MRIFKNVLKRTATLLLALTMVLSMLPQLATTAQAAVSGPVVTGLDASGDNAWSVSGTTITGTVTSTANKDNCGNVKGYTTKSSTLTLTNTSGEAKMLSFSWSLGNGGSVTFNDKAQTASGTYNEELAAGATLKIKITSNGSNANATTLNLSGIALQDKGQKYDITFAPGTNGTYTANNETITVTTSKTQVESGTKYTLEAIPNSGYKLRHWEDGDGNILSTASTYEMILSGNITVKPVFIKADTAMFGVGDKTFYDLNEADAYAKAQGGKQINLLNDGTLYAGTYTISSGNTLLIPFDTGYTCYKETPVSTGSAGLLNLSVTQDYTTPSLYRKLTMANGAHIAVNGAISVSAKNAAGISTGAAESNKCGAVTGQYGQIQMNAGSAITVNNGGAFYAWGYVTGDGSVTANSGAKVYELMQVTEFRGGTILKDLASNPDNTGNVFPLSQYYVQNIEVLLTLHAGATEFGYTAILAKGMGKQSSTAQFIGSQGMFRLNSGYVTKYYNRSTDRLHLDIYGDVTLGQLSMGIGDVNIDSSEFVLPITNNVTITAHSGKVTLNQKVALLPGVEVYVNKGAELEVASGMEAFVYDATEWNGKKFVHGGQNVAPVVYVPGGRVNRTTTPADCIVDVNGKATVNGDLYTTSSGARIISSQGTGEIHFANDPGAKTTTYQYQYPGNGVTGVTVTPAKLYNGSSNPTYVQTSEAAAGDVYLYDNATKTWYKDVTVTYDANGGTGTLEEVYDYWPETLENTNTFDVPVQHLVGDDPYNKIELPAFAGFTKPGYEATRWNTKADGTGTAYQPGDVYTLATSPIQITFYAQWAPKMVTVTLLGEDDAQLKEPVTGQATTAVNLLEGVTLPEAATGHSLKWKDHKGNVLDELPAVYPEENTTYQITWVAIPYDITYDLAGGAVNGSNPATYTIESEDFTLINPTKEGHTFLGWTGSNGTTPETTVTVPKGSTEAKSYTANWKVNQYKAVFKAGEGTFADGTTTKEIMVNYGETPVAPEAPSKFEHTFAGWSPALAPMGVAGAEYTANYNINKYTIKFVNEDGTVLQSGEVAYGETPVYNGETPTKAADAQYTYTFKGWDKKIVAVTGDVTYTATYDNTVNKYTVKFEDEDGTVLQSSEVAYGETPAYNGETPTKAATAQYTYTFKGWDQEIVAVTGDATYTATYSTTTNKYTIKFVDEGGAELQSSEVAYGETPAYTGETPTKAANAQYSYTFAGWTPTIETVTGEATYTATYTSTVNQYTVTWIVDGKETTETYEYGATPSFTGSTDKAATAQYTYTFAGWTPTIATVTGNATYTATYTSTVNEYTVDFKNDDGTMLQSIKVAYGETPAYTGKTPTKAADAQYTYTFAGWDPEIVDVTGDATYTATYDSTVNKYTVKFVDEYGTELQSSEVAYGTVPTAPEAPAKAGYSFVGWDPEVVAVTGTAIYKATYTANDVGYTVETYIMDLNGEYGAPVTEKKSGLTDAAVSVTPEIKEGFILDASSVLSGTVAADGSTVLKVYYSRNLYTVNYTVDGEAYKTQTYFYGADVTALAQPTKEGYTFSGWSEIPATMPASNVTVSGTFTINTYTVTWTNENGETLGTDNVQHGSDAENIPELPAKPGYTGSWSGSSDNVTGNTTIQATYDPNNYAVAWIVDGEAYTWTEGAEEKTQTVVVYDQPIVIPAVAPVKEGHTFQGWYTGLDGTGTKIETGETIYNFDTVEAVSVMAAETEISGTTTLYAHFTVNSYNVKWIVDGVERDESYVYGTAINKPADPSKTGYTFDGWTPTVPAKMPAADQTFTATWKINQYTITFKNTGDTVVNPIKQDYNTTVTAPANPTKTGYNFTGWDIAIPAVMPANNVTVTATWSANQYSVNWNVDGETYETTTQTFDEYLTLPAEPTKEGYTFVGWFTDLDNNSQVNANTVYRNADETTYYARWKAIQYTVTWNVDGVETTSQQTFDANLQLPAAPSKTGYTFMGWFTATEGGTQVTADNIYKTAGPATYYAQWTETQYTITYVGVDGIVNDNDGGYDVEHLPVTIHEVAKANFVFLGWTCDELKITTPVKNLEIPEGTTENLTMKANFEKAYASVVSGETTTYYLTLAEAVAAAESGNTVNLLDNATGAGMTVNKDITINLGGHTYTFDISIGSTGTETLGFQLLQGNTVTIKNGELTADPEATNAQGKVNKVLIQNYANLNLENVTLTANKNTLYCLSINSGNVSIKDCKMDAAPGKVAFDVCKYASYDAPVVNAQNCTITGIVEVTGGELTVDGGTYTTNDTDVFVVDTGLLTLNGDVAVDGGGKNQTTAVWAKNTGKVVINGGSYKVSADAGVSGGYNDLIYAKENAVIEINGGTFEGPARTSDGQKFLLNLQDKSNAKITVKGGLFKGFDPQAANTEPGGAYDFTAEGYIAVDDGDGNFTVIKHTHAYTYSATGLVITENCFEGCRHSATAELVKNTSVSLVYNGNAIKPYSVTTSDGWAGGELQVVYENNVAAGQAKAIVTIGDATVSDSFTITNASLTGVSVSQIGVLTYTGEAQTPQVNAAAVTVDGKEAEFTYSTAADGEFGAMPTFTDAGTYTVYYKASAASHDEVSGSFTVQVERATPDYTVPADLTGAFGQTLADITLPAGWTWDAPATRLDAAGEQTFAATFTHENKNYKPVTVVLSVNVFKPTVTWDMGGIPWTIAYEAGQEVSAPFSYSKPGYDFAGWYNGDQEQTMPFTMPGENITLTAKMVPITYTVSYDLAGGAVAGNNPATYNIESDSFTLVNPTKEGHTFAGWTGSNGNDPQLEVTVEQGSMGNKSYTANWTVNTYSITWNLDEGTADFDLPDSAEYGQTVTISGKPTKTGYTFETYTSEQAKLAKDENGVYTFTMPASDVEITASWIIKQFTITFATNGGTEVAPITQNYNSAVIAPAAPEKTGYTFAGWTPELPATMPAENLNLVAQWTINRYTVSLDTDGDGEIDKKQQTEYNSTLALADGFKAADKVNTYTFLGWSLTPDGEVLETLPKVTEDATYYARFSTNPIIYTVTLDTQGGSQLAALTGGYEAQVTLPEATGKTGYTFRGWATTTDPDAEILTSEYTITEDDTLYAVWDINSYAVKWIVDGVETEAIYEYGAAIVKPADPSKEGYNFTGWDAEIPATMPDKDLTFTAQWQIKTYQIGWDTDEDGVANFTDTVEWNTVPEYDAEKHGIITKDATVDTVYTFAGWTVEPVAATQDVIYIAKFSSEVRSYTITWKVLEEETTTYVPYGVVPTWPNAEPVKAEDNYNTYAFAGWSPELTAVTGTATYEAQFTSIAKVYTLTIDLDGGAIGEDNSVVISGGYETQIPELAEPAKTGYTFAGWSEEIPALLTETKTIKALWTINSYTITFAETGDSTIDPITQEYGTAITAPADPVKVGHTFAGWSEQIPATMPAKDLIITGNWTVNQYTITFLNTGDSDMPAITLDYAAAIGEIADPVKAGYTFTGWDAEIPATMPAQNLTLSASWKANENTISIYLEKEDEEAYCTIVAETDADITEQLPVDPEKEGHVFGGWVDAEGNPVVLTGTMPTSSMTLYAKWNVSEYTITFDCDGGKLDGDSIYILTADFGTELTAPEDPTREGYTFRNWVIRYTSGEEVLFNMPETMPAFNMTVTAVWEINQYTITFQDNEGNKLTSSTQDYGTPIQVPQVSKVGHTFVSWDSEIPGTMPAHDVVITSTWNVNAYTITFDTDGGSDVEPITQNYATAVKAPAAPVKTGYTFLGWEPALPETMPAENVTLKAQWALNQYLITWNQDDGTALATTQVSHGDMPVYPNDAPVKASDAQFYYTFAGWTPEIVEATENTTYTAVFDAHRQIYTITYVFDNGEENQTVELANGAAVVAPAEPVKNGYVFTGWNPALPETMPTENITATAQWTKVTYTITFDTDGGSAVAPITIGWGEPVIAPAAPEKTGYTFAGWMNANNMLVDLPEVMPVGGMALKAKWSVNNYTITFNTDGGSEIAPITLAYGSEIIAPEAPVKDGYIFTGWNPALPETMPAQDITVVAQWHYNYTGWLKDEIGITYLVEGEKAYFDSWKEIDDNIYFFNDLGYVVTGLNELDARDGDGKGTYLFDEDGKLMTDYTDTYTTESGKIYWVVEGEVDFHAGLVRTVDATGHVHYYYFCDGTDCNMEGCDKDGTAVKGGVHWTTNTHDMLPAWDYTFDENGVIEHDPNTGKNGFLNERDGSTTYYIDGIPVYMGLMEYNGHMYYVRSNGKVVKSQFYWISRTNDILPERSYWFNKLGQLVIGGPREGVYEENGSLYYYELDVPAYVGLIKYTGQLHKEDGTAVDGIYVDDYIYVSSTGELKNSCSYWITKTNGHLSQGNYTFDEYGRYRAADFVLKDGFVEENGNTYYYVNGKLVYAGLIYVDGYYYYVNSSGRLITNATYWITKTNGLKAEKAYAFDEKGRMILDAEQPAVEKKNGIYQENGAFVYYVNDQKTYAGLIKFTGDVHYEDGTVEKNVYQDDYIYVNSSYKLIAGCKYWVSKTNGNLAEKSYTFDAFGRLIQN